MAKSRGTTLNAARTSKFLRLKRSIINYIFNINNMHEKSLRWLSRRNMCITQLHHQLRHPGHTLDLKAKDLIDPDETLLFISQSQSRILMCNLHCITLFALVLHFFALSVTHFAFLSQPIRIKQFCHVDY